ncbi:TauD/TfdA family dioxygenase [Streptomyces sp. DSM 44917]|uniref:TauD/TfdA family dioxygenase n=1 Tax=Streptomyces boetiae TaxID=3075541 RepID=A0ABU2L390_9ACTN|nr:TauD/TfdA family dioxygenase [Streptomyces sp. DSM 44917]MDT0306032.1 TauD/TfdA family dioxygenase [Streptomyces sp. DSM 44917]
MDLSAAGFVPSRVSGPREAREAIAAEGAALVPGVAGEAEAVAFGRRVMGARAVRIGTQIEATKERQEREGRTLAAQPPDARGRTRAFAPTDERMVAHNDGFAFGDLAPDYLFLWCERPAERGGESFLIDTRRLIALLAAAEETVALADFCREVPVDHSEPHHPQDTLAPIVRMTRSGRFQGRYHPYLSPAPGEREAAHWPLVRAWEEAVVRARDTGPMFRAEAGDLICVDNYRVLHGRDGHSDPRRRVCSIWGWSTEAVAVPEGPLDFIAPRSAA